MVKKISLLIAVAITLFQLYTATFGVLTPVLQRSIHITLILMLFFIITPTKTKTGGALNYGMAAIAAASGLYLYFSFDTIIDRIGYLNIWDVLFGTLFVSILLIATKRIVGWAMTVVVLVFLAYGFTGQFFPEAISHKGYDLNRIATTMFLTTDGIFGSALGAAATFVALFIIFGTFLEKSGAAQIFIDLACSVGGKKRGGPAKVAVFASALTGTVNGSPVANVSTTGTFTIPLMKRIGYPPKVAAAVEAVASSGGSIMPPIMGAGAFVMAEMTGIPYGEIALAAIIPALLYYLAIYLVVDFIAARKGLKGLSDEEIPPVRDTLKRSLPLIIPLGVLILCLVVFKFSAMKSALYGILAVMVMGIIVSSARIGWERFIEILELSAKRMIMTSVACAAAGIVVGIITLTGIGLKFSGILIEVGQSSLLYSLLLTMLGAIIMGMGLPPTAAYIVFSVLGAPALVQLGVPLLAAHLFIFYFTCFAPITPPVALAAFTGAGIAGSNPMKTGFTAWFYALPGFIIPFIFVYGPELLAQGEPLGIAVATISACLGIYAFASGLIGWMGSSLNVWQRAINLSASVVLIIPGTMTDIIGVVMIALTYLSLKLMARSGQVTEPQQKEVI